MGSSTMREHFRFVAMMMFVLVCVLAAYLEGCGPSMDQIQTQYQDQTDLCIDQLNQLKAECPHGQDCVDRLHRLRAECDLQLQRICHQSRRARRICP